MAIDPFSVPFMQQAFGGGPLTEREMKQLLQSSPALGGMMGGMFGGGFGGMRGAPSAPIMQGPGVIEHGSSGRGMNSLLVGQMLSGHGGGPRQATMGSNGNWIPGPGGFPTGGADYGGFGGPTDPLSAVMAGGK